MVILGTEAKVVIILYQSLLFELLSRARHQLLVLSWVHLRRHVGLQLVQIALVVHVVRGDEVLTLVHPSLVILNQHWRHCPHVTLLRPLLVLKAALHLIPIASSIPLVARPASMVHGDRDAAVVVLR